MTDKQKTLGLWWYVDDCNMNIATANTLAGQYDSVDKESIKQQLRLIQEEVKEPTFTDDGKRIFTVTATFEVSAPKQTPTEKIINKLQGMIEGAGITSLKKIEVR